MPIFKPFRNLQGRGKDAASSASQSFTSSPNPASSVPTSGQSGVRTPAQNKMGIKMLQYPSKLDVAGQGHYIIFKIMDIKEGKIQKSNQNMGGKRGRTLTSRRSSNRVKTQIGLYMPPSVKTEYKSEYQNQEIGALSEAVGQSVADAVSASSFEGAAKNIFKNAKGAAKDAAIDMAIAAGNMLGPQGLVEAGQILSGKIRSKKMELMFKGVGRRTFNYTFIFIPKSKEESNQVDNIVYEFKKAMLPSYTTGFLGGSGNDRTLKIPTTFNIEYFFDSGQGGRLNNFLNKISTCYLTDVSVQYGGDRYKAYSPSSTTRPAGGGEGAPPQKTVLTLNFSEIEIITQEDIDLGF